MTAAALAFPTGRTVAGLWQQLHAFHPSSLLLAHLSLHQVECLARVERASPLDRMNLLTLEGLSLAADASPGQAPFSAPIFQSVVRRLQSQGLVFFANERRWKLTAAGEQAVCTGVFASSTHERRVFHFLDSVDGVESLTFIDLHPPPGSYEAVSEARGFDLARLRECVNRPEDWKRLRGFPVEIQAVLEPAQAGDTWTEAEWPRVILVRVLRLFLALIRTRPSQRDERMIGFAVRARDWHLFPNPILDRPAGDPSLPHEWLSDPAPERWRQVWQAWASAQKIADAVAASCSVERRGHRLVVQVPRELWDRWRLSQNDPSRGDLWLLAGEGNARMAAELEFTRSPKRP